MSRVLDLWSGMTGTVLDFAGTTAPTGWLLCFGQSVLRTDYPALFAAIGTTFGAADGTHFTLPDCRGRVAAGKDDMGGAAANRLTAGGSGVAGATLGGAGGLETHTLTSGQLPAHTHPNTLTDPTHNHTISGGNGTPWVGGSGSSAPGGSTFTMNTGSLQPAATGITITNAANTGGGGAHNNAQPTLVLNKIIKT